MFTLKGKQNFVISVDEKCRNMIMLLKIYIIIFGMLLRAKNVLMF